MDFCHLLEIYPTNMGKNFDDAKTASEKVFHKTSEAIGGFIGKTGKMYNLDHAYQKSLTHS